MIQLMFSLDPYKDHFHWLEIDGMNVSPRAEVFGRRLLRTHLPLSWLPATNKKVQYLFLYPADETFPLSLYSHFLTSSAINFTGSWNDFHRLWTTKKVFYGSFYAHTRSWVKNGRENVLVWKLQKDKVEKDIVARIYSWVFSAVAQDEPPCFEDTTFLTPQSRYCPTDKIDEVNNFLQNNNPSTKWRTEREKALLLNGLNDLQPNQKKEILLERDENKDLFSEI